MKQKINLRSHGKKHDLEHLVDTLVQDILLMRKEWEAQQEHRTRITSHSQRKSG